MSPRARVLAIVSVAALAAAGIVLGVTLATRTVPVTTPALKPRPGAPPLVLDLGVRADPVAQAIRRASTLYQKGQRAQAKRVFDRYSDLDAQVGAALAGWPVGTRERLRALAQAHPDSAVVQLNLGFADFWAGKGPAAVADWKAAIRVEPDSASAVRADDLLHPNFPAGLPLYVPSLPLPPGLGRLPAAQQLDALARGARTGGARAKLLYGSALQRLGRQLSAERQFAAAAALAPGDAEAQTAAAVGLFAKAQPDRAFAKLGPLSKRFPRSTTVRFHLGLMLLWLGQVNQARTELKLAVRYGPQTVLGQEAKAFLSRLSQVRTG